MLKKTTNIGTFRLGVMTIAVQVDPSLEGGTYDTHSDKTGQPSMTIGFKHQSWDEVVGVLLHESMEMSLAVTGAKFRGVPMANYDSADCTFMFDHSKFGRVCSNVGCFISEVLPKLATVYNKHKGKR